MIMGELLFDSNRMWQLEGLFGGGRPLPFKVLKMAFLPRLTFIVILESP